MTMPTMYLNNLERYTGSIINYVESQNQESIIELQFQLGSMSGILSAGPPILLAFLA